MALAAIADIANGNEVVIALHTNAPGDTVELTMADGITCAWSLPSGRKAETPISGLAAYAGGVFNIGFGELLLIAVLGLLVFGPDRLPEAVRRGSALVGQLRVMATQARQQVSDAAGLDDAETARVLQDLQDLHPRRVAGSVLNPAAEPGADRRSTGPSRSTGVDPDLS